MDKRVLRRKINNETNKEELSKIVLEFINNYKVYKFKSNPFTINSYFELTDYIIDIKIGDYILDGLTLNFNYYVDLNYELTVDDLLTDIENEIDNLTDNYIELNINDLYKYILEDGCSLKDFNKLLMFKKEYDDNKIKW